MSIARVVTIYETNFKDFTYDTYNYCWPILEYGVAILICCGPLLRPVFDKHSFSSLRKRLKGNEGSSGSATFHNSGRLGFTQLGESDIPLQSITAPISVTSITGNAPRPKHETLLNDEALKEGGSDPGCERVTLPSQSITVERGWNVGGGSV